MKSVKRVLAIITAVIFTMMLTVPAFASESGEVKAAEANGENSVKVSKALSAGIAIAIASAAGAIAMAAAISKSAESISRQPEMGNTIKSNLMLGLVFIETAIIYALIIAILVIFVL